MKKIKVSQSVVDEKEVAAIRRVMLEEGYFGMGKETQAFEKEIQAYLKTGREVVCVNTGTSALHLAVLSVVKPKDEVLIQSLTYVASFQAISAAGAVPVACEIDPKTFTIDLADAAKRLTAKTKAIMPVHYGGDPGELREVYAFAKKHKLRVIEDAAHAFGTIYHGKPIGSFGDIACFSFDPIKNITSGDGGAIVTADKAVAQYVKDARLLGVHNDTEKRYKGMRSWFPEVTGQGYRYHLTNINAAIGRVQLKKTEKFKKIRQKLAARYQKLLGRVTGVTVLKKDYALVVPHLYPILVDPKWRARMREFLDEHGVETGTHYYPNHLLKFYQRPGVRLKITEKIFNGLITIPLHAALTLKQQDKVIGLVRKFFEKVNSNY